MGGDERHSPYDADGINFTINHGVYGCPNGSDWGTYRWRFGGSVGNHRGNADNKRSDCRWTCGSFGVNGERLNICRDQCGHYWQPGIFYSEYGQLIHLRFWKLLQLWNHGDRRNPGKHHNHINQRDNEWDASNFATLVRANRLVGK